LKASWDHFKNRLKRCKSSSRKTRQEAIAIIQVKKMLDQTRLVARDVHVIEFENILKIDQQDILKGCNEI
jgi:hypothetical protein